MGIRRLSLAAGLALSLFATAAPAGDTTVTGGGTTLTGFVELSAGYQRLPAADALYTDADFEVSGGADPRWKPWNPAHLEAARVRAQGALPSLQRTRAPNPPRTQQAEQRR